MAKVTKEHKKEAKNQNKKEIKKVNKKANKKLNKKKAKKQVVEKVEEENVPLPSTRVSDEPVPNKVCIFLIVKTKFMH